VPPESNPSLWHYQVAWARLYLGQDSEALSLISQYLRDRPQNPGGVVTAARDVLEAKHGDARGAETVIAAALTKGVGFQQAASQGLPCYPGFANDPYLGNLRGDPEDQDFMQQLEQQARQSRATVLRSVASRAP
jgi:hypothetical protein